MADSPAWTVPVTLAAPRLLVLCAAAVGIALVALVTPSASGVPLRAAEVSAASFSASTPVVAAHQRTVPRQQPDLHTGLTVTIDDIEPVTLVKGEPLRLSGSVSNAGRKHWRDAQVYLEVAAVPAITRSELDAFASQEPLYGTTRLVHLGQFDEIGPVRPGATASYRLSLPYDELPIAGTPGVYHIGVSVLAQNRAGRDTEADAAVSTLVPLLPSGRDSTLRRAAVATLVPLTAPVLRQNNGNFLDDELAAELTFGGRLRNVLDFAAGAPRGSLQVVLDPALLTAAEAMSNGYVVQTLAEAARNEPGRQGAGQREAATWLQELRAVGRRQQLSLLPWGAPDASALAGAEMPGIVASAVAASRAYATRSSLDEAIVGWQPGGFSTRRGLSATRRAGTSIQVVSEYSLTWLRLGDSEYPPAEVELRTPLGPLTAVVTRADVAGMALTAHTPALQFRQHVLAEATVRSLLNDPAAKLAVFALPFKWDPGLTGRTVDLSEVYGSAVLRPISANAVSGRVPSPYDGPVKVPAWVRPFPAEVLAAIAGLRHNGRVFTGMLTRQQRATNLLNQRLGVAGSATWRNEPRIAAAMVRQQAAALARRIGKVTVTGPAFVALSSASGRFPVTVTNGLSVPITVRVLVRPLNPALKFNSIDNQQLAAGQRRDVQVVSRSEGSGVTQVRVRLATPDHLAFGTPWSFNVRATQFGVVIWIAMGVGAAVLFGAAALRIYRRIRDSRRSTRAQPAAP